MILSLLFNVGVYGSALVAGDLLRRATSYSCSATFQRMRWRRFAAERSLECTGIPGEFTGIWQDLAVVLDTRFVHGHQLVLGLRVLGLPAPEDTLRALRTEKRFAAWRSCVADGELQLQVRFRGSRLTPADLESWLDAVRTTTPTRDSVYRAPA